jgi:hypothetical protein
MKIVSLIMILIAFSFGGCSQKVAPPKSDISNAKIALMKAKDGGASSLAPKEFDRAKEYFDKTGILMKQKKYKKAEQTSQKSYINAKVADAKAKNVKLEKEIQKLKGDINLVNRDFAEIKE